MTTRYAVKTRWEELYFFCIG